jgi:hypothetical protein
MLRDQAAAQAILVPAVGIRALLVKVIEVDRLVVHHRILVQVAAVLAAKAAQDKEAMPAKAGKVDR